MLPLMSDTCLQYSLSLTNLPTNRPTLWDAAVSAIMCRTTEPTNQAGMVGFVAPVIIRQMTRSGGKTLGSFIAIFNISAAVCGPGK